MVPAVGATPSPPPPTAAAAPITGAPHAVGATPSPPPPTAAAAPIAAARAIPQVRPVAAAHHQLRRALVVGVRQRPILRCGTSLAQRQPPPSKLSTGRRPSRAPVSVP
ncbi:atherin-like isoform X4 [Triticum dicoccoides]|uniref:atherin-like isoform X4 n=1 Tax=Triticum dicoccoides TaxID=85692 RepID=UPI00188FA331|nr:atherin-like isoform X4 [Triticum dicoccoides]XP_044348745.1 atherin-like isoform X5 [Triticum aestivum]